MGVGVGWGGALGAGGACTGEGSGTESAERGDFKVGASVLITGLARMEAFNGKQGILKEWNEGKGRWLVLVAGADGAIEEFLLRPENLQNY